MPVPAGWVDGAANQGDALQVFQINQVGTALAIGEARFSGDGQTVQGPADMGRAFASQAQAGGAAQSIRVGALQIHRGGGAQRIPGIALGGAAEQPQAFRIDVCRGLTGRVRRNRFSGDVSTHFHRRQCVDSRADFRSACLGRQRGRPTEPIGGDQDLPEGFPLELKRGMHIVLRYKVNYILMVQFYWS